jgi:hypothetical protein
MKLQSLRGRLAMSAHRDRLLEMRTWILCSGIVENRWRKEGKNAQVAFGKNLIVVQPGYGKAISVIKIQVVFAQAGKSVNGLHREGPITPI